jgi:uncharacterized membrane protein
MTFKKNKDEILYNLINSSLAGFLVFLGTCIDGGITLKGILAAVFAALLVAVTKFKDYWESEKGEYSNKLFTFISN